VLLDLQFRLTLEDERGDLQRYFGDKDEEKNVRFAAQLFRWAAINALNDSRDINGAR
jgi:hypothetical protein